MIRPRPEVVATAPAPHGGPVGADADAAVRLDFSVSLNAWGPAPVVLDAIRAARADDYPDPASRAPRRAAARRWGRPEEEIVFGAGAAELIHAVCFAFLRAGDTVLVPTPTFGEYARAAGLCGARVLAGIADPPAYAMDPDAIATATVRHRPRLVFLCTPNNPTGQTLTRDEVRRVADACATADALLVLDQSYDAFAPEPLGTPALPGHPAVLHLRSITKDHALAGVRAAFAVASPPVAGWVARVRPPWTASAPAQAAAVAALSDAGMAHVAATLPRLRFERELLEAAFARLRFPTVRTGTHFFLAAVGDAARLARSLADDGIRVRDCTSFGLPGHVRVAARTPPENNELIHALEAACSG